MDPEEIARREHERAEKKKRKQEKKLLKSQNKLLHSDSFHTPGGSESDSGVSQFTDSEQQSSSVNGTNYLDLPATKGAGGQQTESSCDQTRHDFSQLQNHQNQRATREPEQVSPGNTHSSSPGGPRSSGLQKRNPFSVESLLSDATPRRKSQLDFPSLPTQRTLVGKGHFLLYPITHQPLGFIVPQTALKATPCQDNNNRLSLGQSLEQRCAPREGSPAPFDLSSVGSTKPVDSDHTELGTQHHHNHDDNGVVGGDTEDCGGDFGGRFRVSPRQNSVSATQPDLTGRSSSQVTDGSEVRSSDVQTEAATADGCQATELCRKEERASPDPSERLQSNADCPERPETDGEDVDMD